MVVRGCELRDWVGRPLPTHLLHPYIRCHHLVLFILGHKQEEDSRFVLGDRIPPTPSPSLTLSLLIYSQTPQKGVSTSFLETSWPRVAACGILGTETRALEPS